MDIKLSKEPFGVMGITGHAGCGHVHSNNGYVQDDSGGLAVILTLLQRAAGLSLRIRRVSPIVGIEGGFEVETEDGGLGRCFARRGVTPQEADLARAIEGESAILTQAVTFKAFGRMYGQGCHEAAVALQTAVANAAMDGAAKKIGPSCRIVDEGVPGNCGKIIGTVLDIAGVPVSVMGLSNATAGGLGPNEDAEGNAYLAGKKDIMTPLRLHRLPTFLVEGKLYSRGLSAPLTENHLFLRASEDDNPVVRQALADAAARLNLPIIVNPKEPKRAQGVLRQAAEKLGESICALGERLKNARTSSERVTALAELAVLVSQDGGGISFMSDDVHAVVAGPGAMPGTSTVISMVAPEKSVAHDVVPLLTPGDVEQYLRLIYAAIPNLVASLPQALDHLNRTCWTKEL